MAKLLFLSNRAMPNQITRFTILTTRVREPNEDNGRKLVRVLKCFQSTWYLVLALESVGFGTIKLWLDADFEIHHDTRSHTGGAISMGKGVIYSASNK